MQYTGVLLDLFGTLVPPYQTPEHRVIMRRCAAILGLSFEDCYRLSGESFRGRMRGLFPTMADNFAWMVRRAGGMAGPAAIRQAEKAYAQFTRDSLVPVPEAQEGLDWLRSRGLRLGLVSNCAPDVPALWKTLPIAESFEFCAFSCVVGSAKPEPEIYRAALEALALRPEETLYVGDDGLEELPGAARCGLHPVQVTTDRSNAPDPQAHDRPAWNGPVIRSLAELPALIEARRREEGDRSGW